MFDEKSEHLQRLLFLLDMCLTALAYVLSIYTYVLINPAAEVNFNSHLALLPLLLAIVSYLLTTFGAYNGLRVTSLLSYGWTVFRTVAISVVVIFTILYALKITYISRGVLGSFSIYEFGILLLVRQGLIWWYFRRAIQKGENVLKVLIIGSGSRAKRLTDTLQTHSEWGVDIVGYLDPELKKTSRKVENSKVLGTIDDIGETLQNHVIDEVIMAIPRKMIDDVEEIVSACEEQGVKFRLMADIYDLNIARMKLVNLDDIPLLSFEPVAQDEVKLVVKRLIDLTLTIAAMPILIPILMITAIAIKLDSPGPIFFKQERVGLRKRIFKMYKFRSMVINSEEILKEIEHMNEADGPNFKIENDPRITRVGRFIRKTSIDELPQLFNVILGHMSLVGPRPMSLRDVNLFDKGIQRKRFSVKPGLTCIWQISGRSNLSFDQWLELDLKYINNWSLGLDMKILLKTIPTVLKGSGAV
jgi:exopolysaccharide biosynthesis polyprenyl glycosylphosphotransferase